MDNLISELQSAFYCERPPELNYFGAGDGDDIEALRGKNWNSITLSDFNDNPWIFFSLPEEALPYYLGAYMVRSIMEDSFMATSFRYMISSTPIRAGRKRNIGAMVLRKSLDHRQVKLLIAYLDFIAPRSGDIYGGEIERFRGALLNV